MTREEALAQLEAARAALAAIGQSTQSRSEAFLTETNLTFLDLIEHLLGTTAPAAEVDATDATDAPKVTTEEA